MSRKAIVTGGAGFVGSHLVDLLIDHEWDVLVLDDLSSGRMEHLADARQRAKVGIHVTDICAPEIGDVVGRFKPEVIFHLAAQSKVRPSVDDPVRDAEINVLGTVRLLAASAAAGVRKVVFTSSGGAIYGGAAPLPAKETATKVPESPYGISKKIVEDYFRWYRDAHGLEYTLIAPANIYGPRQDPGLEGGVVAIFSMAMLAGRRPTIFGDGSQTRDYVYVGDVCDAFLRATEAGDGLLVNIGSGIETSVLELFGALASVTGFGGDPIFADPKAGDVARSVVDARRAKKELGWEAWTMLSDGLRRTVSWYRSDG
jgi:UDP-glucose 4-epimerase